VRLGGRDAGELGEDGSGWPDRMHRGDRLARIMRHCRNQPHGVLRRICGCAARELHLVAVLADGAHDPGASARASTQSRNARCGASGHPDDKAVVMTASVGVAAISARR
jgi:hypothetical protein